MRLRIRFTKTGSMRYVSHLDMMRYFQKALRRIGADVALSEGFSPHMQMSFALPLSLGMTSLGEYFDVDMKSVASTEELQDALNAQMCGEVRVCSVRSIPQDKAHKCMSQVAAADYAVILKDPEGMPVSPDREELTEKIRAFLDQPAVIVLKKTKHKEEETDIRPFIYAFTLREDGSLYFRLRAGSIDHLRCDTVLDAFFAHAGIGLSASSCAICREDLLLQTEDGGFASLESTGVAV